MGDFFKAPSSTFRVHFKTFYKILLHMGDEKHTIPQSKFSNEKYVIPYAKKHY
jgi:hypothetical protein